MNLSDSDYSNAVDLSDYIPAKREVSPEGKISYSHNCLICDSNIWTCDLVWGDFEVAGYMTEMTCKMCNTKMKAPTLIDHPDYAKE